MSPVCPGIGSRAVQHISRCAVRPGIRHNNRSGRCQSPDVAPRTSANRTQPVDVRAGIQLPRHDDISVRWVYLDSRSSRRCFVSELVWCRAHCLSDPGDGCRGPGIPWPGRRTGDPGRRNLVGASPTGRDAERAHEHPSRVRPAAPPPVRLGRALHFSVCRRRGSDRLADRQLPHAAQHDGAGSAGGRETCRLLLGWGIGGSVYRRLSSGRIVARQDACGVRWRIHCTDTGVDEYGRRSVRMVAAGDWTL